MYCKILLLLYAFQIVLKTVYLNNRIKNYELQCEYQKIQNCSDNRQFKQNDDLTYRAKPVKHEIVCNRSLLFYSLQLPVHCLQSTQCHSAH